MRNMLLHSASPLIIPSEQTRDQAGSLWITGVLTCPDTYPNCRLLRFCKLGLLIMAALRFTLKFVTWECLRWAGKFILSGSTTGVQILAIRIRVSIILIKKNISPYTTFWQHPIIWHSSFLSDVNSLTIRCHVGSIVEFDCIAAGQSSPASRSNSHPPLLSHLCLLQWKPSLTTVMDYRNPLGMCTVL